MEIGWLEIGLMFVIAVAVIGPKRWLELLRSLRQAPAEAAATTTRNRQLLALAVLLLVGQLVLFALGMAKIITATQVSIAMCVWAVWLIVGWLCFAQESE